jgi:hypothetical protein
VKRGSIFVGNPRGGRAAAIPRWGSLNAHTHTGASTAANTFGITLVPMLLGFAILFWNGKSTIGWVLTAGGALFIWLA